MPLHPIGPEGSAGHQPGTPTIGTATAGDASASVTFNAPAYLGKPIGTTYTAISSPGGITSTSSTTPITVTGLTNGTTYTFTVKLSNSITDSLPSSASNAVTPAVPFGFTPFGFTPFGFTPFGFTPFGFTPFGFTPFGFTPAFSFAPLSFFFTPAPFSFYPEFSVASSTGIRTPYGIVDAQYISVGDVLHAMEIDMDVEDWTSWTSENLILNQENLRETTVVSISTKIVDQLYSINGDLFSESHYIFTKKDGIYKFIKISELDASYMIYSYTEQDFINIISLEVVPQQEMVYSINCEPYDNFFTENALVFDTPDHP